MSGHKKDRGIGFWVAVGCGGLGVLGVCGFCVGPAAFGMLMPYGMFGEDSYVAPLPHPDESQHQYETGGAGPMLPPPRPPLLPVDPDGLGIRDSLTLEIEVTQSDAPQLLPIDARCAFEIERRPLESGGYRCHTAIVCGDHTLYGGQDTGFFQCFMTDDAAMVSGSDEDTTEVDTDAAFSVNSAEETVTIRDDETGANGAFAISARILSIY